MKISLLIVLIIFLPQLIFSQGYTNKFSDMGTKDLQKAQINKDVIPVNSNTLASQLKISITSVPLAASSRLELKNEDNAQIIAGKYDGVNQVMVFELTIGDIKSASGRFQLFYNNISQGVYTFKVDDESFNNEEEDQNLSTYLGALGNANFIGNNKFLSNLTPIVTLGALIDLKHHWKIDMNPYLGSQIDTKDSVSFIPALMLPGRLGLIFNIYKTFNNKNEDVQLILMSGFGLKMIPNMMDSGNIIWQHNLRTGMAFRYKNDFLLGVQYTHGWHNATSESKKYFTTIFNTVTDIDYLTVSGQFFIKGKADKETNNCLFLEWRGLLSTKRYAAFTNSAILTVGIRKDMTLTGVFPAKAFPNNALRRVHNSF